MRPTAAEILQQALGLDEADRASVAGALIESLETEADPAAGAGWDAEIRRRVEQMAASSVDLVPWSEVRERLFRGFE